MEIKKELRKYSNPKKAKFLSGFFKTGKGEYGEGDKFIGVTLPSIRKVSTMFKDTELKNVQILLDSEIHEERLLGAIILTNKYPSNEDEVYKFYLKNSKRINNWDIVDVSAHKIVGPYLLNKDKKILYKLAKSKNLWERRIAIVSTFYFIKNKSYKDIIKLCEILIDDKEDLIHKATGWMLREVGKMNKKELDKFLDKYHKKMPRTMLRYSLEKHSKNERIKYMKK